MHGQATFRRSAALCALLMILRVFVFAPARADAAIEGMTVFLDPGHNGANDASIARQVPDGRGGTKECQTTGAGTEDGYSDTPSTSTWHFVFATPSTSWVWTP